LADQIPTEKDTMQDVGELTSLAFTIFKILTYSMEQIPS